MRLIERQLLPRSTPTLDVRGRVSSLRLPLVLRVRLLMRLRLRLRCTLRARQRVPLQRLQWPPRRRSLEPRQRSAAVRRRLRVQQLTQRNLRPCLRRGDGWAR